MGHDTEPKAEHPVRIRLTRDLEERIEKARAMGMHAALTKTDFLLVLLSLGLDEADRIESMRRGDKRSETIKAPNAANSA